MMADNVKIILGGDFNTVLDGDLTVNNKDLIGRVGSIPNAHNSRVITDWIASGRVVDPFRFIHTDRREISYVPFRQRLIGNRGVNAIRGIEYSKARFLYYISRPT